MTRVLIPSGALGLGCDQLAMDRAIAAKPDIIAIDGGSTDSGPSYLGRGVSKYSRASTRLEWKGLMQARAKAGVPLVIGTAGTCGSDSAVDWLLDITRDIAEELDQTLKIAVLRSSQAPDYIADALTGGKLSPLSPAPDISEEAIKQFTNIVALAGAEQIQAAISTGADIIIAGRTTDTAIIAALPLMQGCHAGAAWHGAKIGECGALCATNPQSGVVLIDFDESGFTITPTADGANASPHTVSAHMLYENADPFILHEPGGHLDVTDAQYEAIDSKSVRATGARWVPSEQYTVKLEGARIAGYQVMAFALLRDRRYVDHAQQWADDITQKARSKAIDRLGISGDEFSIELRLIGKNATFGALEPDNSNHRPTEIGVMGFVTANSLEQAQEIGKILNPYLLHHPLTQEEEQPTFAFQFSPAEVPVGPVYEFCLNHVMELKDPMEAFKLETIEVGHG
ncbi:acyclic terpene utilization AtuA family protein [Pararhizobium sp. IMCC21322]|uniref:acyclic terpene utilization AtuA family protein n=1 Tax=Pararhizobium sp. IMCC21322 TaxID=3067903 RepID=UPI0027415776|nr:acyclic terpene utilization AtuA family protein [Pararhizobium sp. IMCC21322]